MQILFYGRSAIAVDKPVGWLLAPETWRHTGRNLQLTLTDAIARGAGWVKALRIRFLRYVHRLDADTSGVLLLAKSSGAVRAYSQLFRERRVEKSYLAVVVGRPTATEWTCRLNLSADLDHKGRVIPASNGEVAETWFRVVHAFGGVTLIEARPLTGRTHQIRVHLAEAGCPIKGDALYGPSSAGGSEVQPLALRAVGLAFRDPFERRAIKITAPVDGFVKKHGFEGVWTHEAGRGD